jgi:hypothetical protein
MENRERDNNFAAIPLLVIPACAISIVVFLALGFSRLASVSAMQNWPTAKGTIVDVFGVASPNAKYGNSYQPLVEYDYTIDGRTYSGSGVSPYSEDFGSQNDLEGFKLKYPVGTRVAVYYNPDDIGQTALDKSYGYDVIWPFFAAAAATIILICLCPALQSSVVKLLGYPRFLLNKPLELANDKKTNGHE